MTNSQMALREFDQNLTRLEGDLEKIDAEIGKLSKPFAEAVEANDSAKIHELNQSIAELEAKKRAVESDFLSGQDVSEDETSLKGFENSIANLECKTDVIDSKIAHLSEQARVAREGGNSEKENSLFKMISAFKNIRKQIMIRNAGNDTPENISHSR